MSSTAAGVAAATAVDGVRAADGDDAACTLELDDAGVAFAAAELGAETDAAAALDDGTAATEAVEVSVIARLICMPDMCASISRCRLTSSTTTDDIAATFRLAGAAFIASTSPVSRSVPARTARIAVVSQQAAGRAVEDADGVAAGVRALSTCNGRWADAAVMPPKVTLVSASALRNDVMSFSWTQSLSVREASPEAP